jgi:hypothetical protein
MTVDVALTAYATDLVIIVADARSELDLLFHRIGYQGTREKCETEERERTARALRAEDTQGPNKELKRREKR